MKWFLGLSFIATAALCAYQNTVIRKNTKTLAMYEDSVKAMAKAYEAADRRSHKWESSFYKCVRLQVVSVP